MLSMYSNVQNTHRGIILHTNCRTKEIFIKPLHVVLTNNNIRIQHTRVSNKSSCLLLGSRQRLNNLSLKISISGVGLNMCTETKLLGIIIDDSLSWEKQIEYVCNKVSPKIGILYRLSKFLSQKILNIIYNTIIQPDFDYCVTVWGNCSSVHFNKLQKLQNRAARIIC